MILNALSDLLFPRTCHVCGEKLSLSEKYICDSCILKLPRTNFNMLHNNPMEERFAGRIDFVRATAGFQYSRSSDFARLIHDFKYHRFPGLAQELGKLLALELDMQGFFEGIDALQPIPMHFLKKMRRGYNQTDYIARGINSVTGIDIIDSIAMRHPHQSQTGRFDRWQNADNIFRIRKNAEIENLHILLVDDVCTSGATLFAAAKTLKDSADIRVSMLSLGVTLQ